MSSYEAYQPMLTSRFNLRHPTKIPLLPLSSTHLTRKTHTRKPVVFQGSFAQPMGEVTTILGADWHRCKVPGKCRVPIGAHRFPSTKQRIDDYTAKIHIPQPSMPVTTMNFHIYIYIYRRESLKTFYVPLLLGGGLDPTYMPLHPFPKHSWLVLLMVQKSG